MTDQAREIAGRRIANINMCEHFEDHTVCPEGYIQWHAWAEELGKTHKQRKCPGCGYYAIWEEKAVRAILQEQANEE